MRYVGNIITAVRERTDNLEFTRTATTGAFTEGLSNNLILEFLNDAQDYLQSRIIQVFSSAFLTDDEISLTANTELYNPSTTSQRVHLSNRINNVEYSNDGAAKNYRDLPKRGIEDRDTSTTNIPSFYIRAKGGILVNPIPRTTKGKIRVTFPKELDDLDIRRGKITSTTATTIVLEADSDLDENAINSNEYLCIVDSLGVVQDYGVVISSYASGTRTITIPSTTLTGGTDDYIVVGQYATTHSDLPDATERFLKLYAQLRTLHKDSSEDQILENPELQRHERDILDAYAELDHDIVEIPLTNKELAC